MSVCVHDQYVYNIYSKYLCKNCFVSSLLPFLNEKILTYLPCCPPGSNWASRQGLTDMVRYYLKSLHVKTGEKVSDVKLSVVEEVSALLFCNFLEYQ